MENLRIGNKSLIKDLNRALVIKEIRGNGPISRTDVSKKTKLVLSTITKICDDLFDQNIIFAIGEGVSTGGRKPLNLVFNNNFGYIIAIKIEDRKVILTLTNLKPIILKTIEFSFNKYETYKTIEPQLFEGVAAMVSEVSGREGEILGIGIAISGIVDYDGGQLTSSSLLKWKNINFKAIFEEKFGIDVHVDNDVNCYALAQKNYGLGKGVSHFVNMTIGEGVGSGIIINNKLYRGAFGGAGEIGHTIINMNGRSCYCGQKGCLEAYASDEFIIDYMEEETGKRMGIDEIVALAESGDFDAISAFRISSEAVGYGLINLIMSINPEKVIVSRRRMKDSSLVDKKIMSTVHKNWFFNKGHFDTIVEFDELTNDKFLLGAATLVIDEILREPIYKDKKTIVDGIDRVK